MNSSLSLEHPGAEVSDTPPMPPVPPGGVSIAPTKVFLEQSSEEKPLPLTMSTVSPLDETALGENEEICTKSMVNFAGALIPLPSTLT